MKLAVIGTGYVGLVTGACLAGFGNEVFCVDVDAEKLDLLKRGKAPFYEPGLDMVIEKNQREGRLFFTDDLTCALHAARMCFITVGTPSDTDGSADLKSVTEAAAQIGRLMDGDLLIVTKSTVPVGTADTVKNEIRRELSCRNSALNFSVASNPEFLREGSAVGDFLYPDRVIIGADDAACESSLRELYSFVPQEKIIAMDIRSAEMTKYAANALLATKISFMNEMSRIAELVGADIEKVRHGIGSDGRIGYAFISPGCGYGGSCFPKDVRAIKNTALKKGYAPRILQAVEDVNDAQKQVLFAKIMKHFAGDIRGRQFAIWGLSFKPNTSDIREAASLPLIRDLLGSGAAIKAHDPVAMDEARKVFGQMTNLEFVQNHYEALTGSCALILVTEWDIYKQPDFAKIARLMDEAVIFDGRNQYIPSELRRSGFTYYGIGRGL